MNLSKPKSVYCVQKGQITPPREESVAIATPAELSTAADNSEDNLPVAEIRHFD